jgi:hypothetical protein
MPGPGEPCKAVTEGAHVRIRTLALASQNAHMWIIAGRTLGRRRLRDTQVRSRLCRGVPPMTNLGVSENNTPAIPDDTASQVSLGRARSMSHALAGLPGDIEGMGAEPGESDAPSVEPQSLVAKLERHKTLRPRTLRGDICALLNPMVSTGVIRGFSTNLSENPSPRDLVVTVRAVCQDGADDAFRIVTQALTPLGHPIIVNVGEPDLSGVQAPAGGT